MSSLPGAARRREPPLQLAPGQVQLATSQLANSTLRQERPHPFPRGVDVTEAVVSEGTDPYDTGFDGGVGSSPLGSSTGLALHAKVTQSSAARLFSIAPLPFASVASNLPRRLHGSVHATPSRNGLARVVHVPGFPCA